jgi:class 3 adenylate cyclase/tetratricopeptide (TPR) repeat protein
VQERRLATVLFADVVGFTSLAERTDPEVVARIVDAAFRELAAVVIDHGGTIDKYMGDSLMAVFGVPVAHDDDAERAVAAALTMRKLGGDLVFSIGINSGEVMATPIGGNGGMTVIGDAVNVAARLEEAAGPGEVLCGPLTVELVGARGVFRCRQPVILKGKREPLEVAEAVALRAPATEADEGLAGVALVGRDDELAYLGSLWQRVCRDRQFHMVLLCGDAGSGKTSVTSALAAVAAADGKVVRASYPAYGPMGGVAVVEQLLRQIGPANDEEVAARVRSLAGDTDAALRSLDPEGLQKEQLWGFLKLLEEKGGDNPLLVVLDDVHRGSETFLKFVSDVTRRLLEVPVLVVLSGRSEPGAWLSYFPSATTLHLPPLCHTDAVALARAFVPGKPLADDSARLIVERAGGNPLYMRELIRMAQATGSLIDEGGFCRLGSPSALPASLHGVLSARLDSLTPAHKAAFQLVTVLGEDASVEAVSSLGRATGRPESGGALASLVAAGMLRRTGAGIHEAADPLLSEVAYEMLPRNIRGDLHRRASRQSAGAEGRARHLERAAEYLTDDVELRAEAAGLLAELGEEYFSAARYQDAMRLLERAIGLGCRRPAALLRLADLQGLSSREEAAVATLRLIDDAADPYTVAERDHAAARIRMFSDPVSALAQLEEVAARWNSMGNRSGEAWGLANAGVASFNLNQMEHAAELLERALAIFEATGDRAGAVSTSSFLCLVKPADKRASTWLADALAFADETGDRSKQLGALSLLAWNHFLRSIWGNPTDTAEAERFAARLGEVATELLADEMTVEAHSLMLLIARWSGRIDLAASHHEGLRGALAWGGAREYWIGLAAGFAMTTSRGESAAPPWPPVGTPDPVAGVASTAIRAELAFAGRVDEAAARYDAVAHPHGAMADAAHIIDAVILTLAGREPEARPLAERALTAARVLDARPTETIARTLLAQIDCDPAALDPIPVTATSVADLVLLRAHALAGSEVARARLDEGTCVLRMPGLLT